MFTLPTATSGNKSSKLLIALLAMTGLIFSASLFFYETAREERVYEQYREAIKAINDTHAVVLAEKASENSKRVQLLSNLPYFQDFIHNPPSQEGANQDDLSKTKQHISQIFITLLEQEKDLRQARIILNDGVEYIRVEQGAEKPFITPSNLLQSKEDREYFKLGMGLADKEIYISQISPNYEHDKVEFPIWPTYRIISALRDSKDFIIALLILNIDASDILKKLNTNKRPALAPIENYLINTNGYYIASPDPAILFGKDLAQNDMNWFSHTKNSTPLSENDHFQTTFRNKNYLFTSQKIATPNSIDDRHYYLLTGLATETIDQAIYRQRSALLLPILGFTLFTALVIFFFIRHIKHLEKIYLNLSHYKAIVSNSSDAILSIHKSGEILNWNDAATILFGLNSTEAIGLNFFDLIDDHSKQDFNHAFLDNIAENKVNQRIEIKPKSKHKVARTLLITLCPIDTKSDLSSSIALIIRDITHQKANQEKLEALNSALDEKVRLRTEELEAEKQKAIKANQIKSMFVANISHEIRTPLNGVSGLLSLARDKKNKNKSDDYLKMAQESAHTLNILINDLLDFSKIESGKLDLNPRPFNIKSLLELVITSSAFLIKDKNIELILDTSRIEVCWIMLDSHRIKQILTNLLSNAVKFTNQGEVILIASTYVSQKDKNKVICEFQVNDTGVGIPQDQQNKLFKPFIQASASIANKYGGTGLGLSISKQLCELMKGSLTLKSKTGEGSCFKALIQSDLIQTKLANSDNELINYSSHTIALFIENDHVRRVLRNQLHTWKAQTLLIQSNDHFTEHLKLKKLNLAIIDQKLYNPELDEQLKAQDVRVIYLTDIHQSSEPQFEACFITKPIIPSELMSLIALPDSESAHLKQDNENSEHNDISPPKTRPNTDHDTPIENSIVGIEQEEQSVFVVDDNEINLIVAQGILGSLPIMLDTASNGEDILTKLRALNLQNNLPVILMDCQMPIMDGYTATRLIREGKAGDWLKNAPIIAMTADAMTENKAECKAAGMDDFIGKPFDPEKLKALVSQWSYKKAGSFST